MTYDNKQDKDKPNRDTSPKVSVEQDLDSISRGDNVINSQNRITNDREDRLNPLPGGPFRSASSPPAVVPGTDSNYEDQNNGVAGKEALNDENIGRLDEPNDRHSDVATAATGGSTPSGGTTSRQQKNDNGPNDSIR
jgi:hypothetical protein